MFKFNEKIMNLFQTLSKKFTRIEKEVGASVGLNGSETKVLACLESNQELSHSELVKLCDTDKASMSRVLSKMEKNNLIKSNHTASNKKTLYSKLTEKGKEFATKVKSAFNNCLDKHFGKLNPEDHKLFFMLFKKFLKEEQA